MIKGSHNSFTGYPLLGWQQYLKWFINPFSRCQNHKSMIEMAQAGVQMFDIQLSCHRENSLKISHGIAWYHHEDLFDILRILDSRGKPIYLMIGFEDHWFKKPKDEYFKFRRLRAFKHIVDKDFTNIKVVRTYIEKPWNIIYEDEEITSDMFEKYWSLSWAKSMMKHWWQFYYFIPVPRLWKKLYGSQWDKEAEESGKKFYVTDFV